ncbi:GbpC/Spa domain-containing protein [Limosilactobacillus reuteri]|uniref:GbpC/Spa domain-containing protein n=1 Tax=Limosilactobacillus reuteri TaxID=1598 RepID=UPI000838CC97|nr:GbpC/Spa domain-containing protein [Limosilactobacillus reuteri]OCW65950.1 hypothetical protein BBP10_03040 [Limosilactobacillus reuteri]
MVTPLKTLMGFSVHLNVQLKFYNLPTIKFWLLTQKRNNEKYEYALNKWKNSTPNNPNAVNPNEVAQALVLESEPDAKLTVNSPYKVITRYAGGDKFNGEYQELNYASAGPIVNGVIGTATWTNLTHSSYTDQNGKKHRIAKEVVTFKNPKTTGATAIKMGKNIAINKNPVKFICYASDEITTDIQFYDEQGRLIDFSNTSAYLSPMSLNGGKYFYYDGNSQGKPSLAGSGFEGCQVLSGGHAYALAGSSVNLHNGDDLFADSDNQNKDNGSPYSLDEWDKTGSPMQYYGAGLIKLTGNTLSLRWHVQANEMTKEASRVQNRSNGKIDFNIVKDNSLGGPWAELTTVIPQNGSVPKRKTTQTNYHYNTAAKLMSKPNNYNK